MGVVAAGTLVANAATYLDQQLWQGVTEIELLQADMQAQFAELRAGMGLPPASASFVPAAVRAATGPVRQIGLKGGPLVPFVQVPFHGHTLHYCAAEDVLLCSTAPNTYQRVSNARMLAALAATPLTGRKEPARLPVGDVTLVAAPFPDLDVAAVLAAEARKAVNMAAFERVLWEGLEPKE